MKKFAHVVFLKGICLMLLSGNGYAEITVENNPTTTIQDDLSELDRPEGVTFSPDGAYVVAANALVDTVTFYKRVGDSGSVYETTPSFSLKGKNSKLKYPHDIAFSPDGSRLAVANRTGNSITIYKRKKSGDQFETKPVATIKGEFSGVAQPDSVRYSPTENVLAVANKGSNSITFYRYQGDVYDQIPYQIIQDAPDILSVPDSLDFSRDGELLAATSHDSHSVLIYQRIPGSEGMYTSRPVQIIQGAESNFRYPHSVCFHPSGQYLLVSNSEGQKNINVFEKISEAAPFFSQAPVLSLEITQMYCDATIHLLEELHEEGGCKGVSFSPDGTSLAITQNLCADQLKLPYSVGVLLIYSVSVGE